MKKKRGRKRKSQLNLDALLSNTLSEMNSGSTKCSSLNNSSSQTLDFAKTFPNSPSKVLQKHSKEELASFLNRLGYQQEKGNLGSKWACKNCLFFFVIDHLAYGGD